MKKKLTFLSFIVIIIILTFKITTYISKTNPFVGRWQAIGASDKDINDNYSKNKYYITFGKDSTATIEYITEGIKTTQKYFYNLNTLAFDDNSLKTSFTYEFKDKNHFSIINKSIGQSTEYEKVE